MSQLERIAMHWPAGSYTANSTDRAAYNFLVEGDGRVVAGDQPVEAQIPPLGNDYAAHTLNYNSYAIGIAICGMHNAVEKPFDAGPYPIKKDQLGHFVRKVAELSLEHDIPVGRETIYTHAEVQITFGVAQNAKWDITWLPGMSAAGDPISVGDVLRDMVAAKLKVLIGRPGPIIPVHRPAGSAEALAGYLRRALDDFEAAL